MQISFKQRSKTEGSPGGILSQFKCYEVRNLFGFLIMLLLFFNLGKGFGFSYWLIKTFQEYSFLSVLSNFLIYFCLIQCFRLKAIRILLYLTEKSQQGIYFYRIYDLEIFSFLQRTIITTLCIWLPTVWERFGDLCGKVLRK